MNGILEIVVEVSHEIGKSLSDIFVTRSPWTIRRKGMKDRPVKGAYSFSQEGKIGRPDKVRWWLRGDGLLHVYEVT